MATQSSFEVAQQAWNEGRKKESNQALACALEDEKAHRRSLAKGMSYLDEDGATEGPSLCLVQPDGRQAIAYLSRPSGEQEDKDGLLWYESLQGKSLEGKKGRSESVLSITPPSSLTGSEDEGLFSELTKPTAQDKKVASDVLSKKKIVGQLLDEAAGELGQVSDESVDEKGVNASHKKGAGKRIKTQQKLEKRPSVNIRTNRRITYSGTINHSIVMPPEGAQSDTILQQNPIATFRHVIVSEDEDMRNLATRHPSTPVVQEDMAHNEVFLPASVSYLDRAAYYASGFFTGIAATAGFIAYSLMEEHRKARSFETVT